MIRPAPHSSPQRFAQRSLRACARRLLFVAGWLALCGPTNAQRVIFPSNTQPINPAYQNPTQPLYTTGQLQGATLNGTIQPSVGAWDPYADAAASQAPALSPYAGTTQPLGAPPFSSQPFNSTPTYSDGFIPQAVRVLQVVSIRNTWLSRVSNLPWEVNDTELYATFALPFNTRQGPAPILITPGFNFHFFTGPGEGPPPQQWDLPGHAFDSYLGTGWKPQFTQRFSADLFMSVGVYGDYSYANSDSIRLIGRGLGLYQMNDNWKLALGAVYFDRAWVKVLPAGGLIWTPNVDTRFDFVFPNPRLAHRLTNIGNGEVWGYLAGEYGGGMWTIQHVSGLKERFDYADLRVMAGAEYIGMRNIRGNFEVGYVFDREITYVSQAFSLKPNDTVMLRAGIMF